MMKKNTKQMLFEMMQKVNPDFILREDLGFAPNDNQNNDTVLVDEVAKLVNDYLTTYKGRFESVDSVNHEPVGGRYSHTERHDERYHFTIETNPKFMIEMDVFVPVATHDGGHFDQWAKWGDGELNTIEFFSDDQALEDKLKGLFEQSKNFDKVDAVIKKFFTSGSE